ncbi:MAG: Crp/Fnr family transcriptional regulator [bacterium]|nr:Crp/Fnr family transcriptional regulator [bacterium]
MKDRRVEAVESLVERLMTVRLFDGMPREVVSEFVRRIGGEVRQFKKGETVVYEGTKAKWVVPIFSGRLTIFESGSGGVRHSVRVVEAGQIFGSTMVTSNLEYYPGAVVAAEPSEVVFLSIPKIRELWHEGTCPKFFENLYSIVSGQVLECWRKMSILSSKKVEDRFMLYLRWYASEVGESDVTLPFATSEACAHYLGVTRTALSLAVRRLVDRGEIVHPGHSRFVICGIV